QVVGPSMLSTDGEPHAHHRGPFSSVFRRAEVHDRFTEFVRTRVQRLLTEIRPAGSAELRRAVAGPLAVAVVAEVLGLAETDAHTVLSWYDAISDAVSGVSAGRAVTEAGAHAFRSLTASV